MADDDTLDAAARFLDLDAGIAQIVQVRVAQLQVISPDFRQRAQANEGAA